MPDQRSFRSTAIVLAIVGALVLVGAGVALLPDHPSAPAPPSGRLAGGWERGVALTDWRQDGLATAAAGKAIDDAMTVGADRIVLSPTLYTPSVDANTVTPDPQRTAGDEALRTAIAAARARGVAVTLKPHVDLADGTARSEIDPIDPTAWFRAYGPWLLHYAKVAQETGVDTLVVGVELTGLQDQDDLWRALVAQVRKVFSGTLTYAANWDATGMTWWDALDLVGVDAYMPVATNATPTDAQLASGWAAARAQLDALHSQWGKPLLLTEIGYPDNAGAAQQPWAPSGAPDPAQQAQAVDAAFRALGGVSWIAGAYWWDWPVDRSQSNAYSLRDAPAARVLAAWQSPDGGPQRAALVPDAPGALLALALIGAALAVGGYFLGWRLRPPQLVDAPARAPEPTPQPEPAGPDPNELERALARALRAHDAETADHCERVGRLAHDVATTLGMPPERCDLLQRLGAMHDVGKLRIPLEILHKPGRLTQEERAVARRWGSWSAELVAHAPQLADCAFLLEHACRLDDGTPLDAQVLAACDAFDSMTHRRPFRPAIQRSAVLAALSADRRLDPRIVEAIGLHAPGDLPGGVDRRRNWPADEPLIGPVPRRRREDRFTKD